MFIFILTVRLSEQIIGRSPLVNSTLLFGSGRSQNGVLIEPVTPVDPENAEKQREFKDAVWYVVQLSFSMLIFIAMY